MQAFPLNILQPYDPAGSLVDVISSSSFKDLAFFVRAAMSTLLLWHYNTSS